MKVKNILLLLMTFVVMMGTFIISIYNKAVWEFSELQSMLVSAALIVLGLIIYEPITKILKVTLGKGKASLIIINSYQLINLWIFIIFSWDMIGYANMKSGYPIVDNSLLMLQGAIAIILIIIGILYIVDTNKNAIKKDEYPHWVKYFINLIFKRD